jgi:hypothetical protein
MRYRPKRWSVAHRHLRYAERTDAVALSSLGSGWDLGLVLTYSPSSGRHPSRRDEEMEHDDRTCTH